MHHCTFHVFGFSLGFLKPAKRRFQLLFGGFLVPKGYPTGGHPTPPPPKSIWKALYNMSSSFLPLKLEFCCWQSCFTPKMNVSQFQYRLLQSFRAIVRWVVACLRQERGEQRERKGKVRNKLKVKVKECTRRNFSEVSFCYEGMFCCWEYLV